MGVLNLHAKELKTQRYKMLTRILGGREDVALGIITHLWLKCLTDKVCTFAAADRFYFIICPIELTTLAIQALVAGKYLSQQDGVYTVVDVLPWVARAHIRQTRALVAAKKSVAVRAQKRLTQSRIKTAAQKRATLPVKKDKKTADLDTSALLAARACWEAYSSAYSRLFHVEPVRNVKVNSLIKQFCQRVPKEDAPYVLQFYVGHGHSFYAQRCYPLDLAVKDAESLYTQWQMGKPITRATMEKFEQRQKTQEALDEGVIF